MKPGFHEESTIICVSLSLALGIGLYFSLPHNPPEAFIWLGMASMLALWLRFARSRQLMRQFFLFSLICCIGFLVANKRSNRIAGPVLPAMSDYYSIEGRVDEYQRDSEGRLRIVVADLAMEGLVRDETPIKIRMQVRTEIDPGLTVGDRIRFDANLSAPQGPVAAGSFNFARNAWFQQIGGIGFAVSSVETLSGQGPQGANLKAIRHDVGGRLADVLTGKEAALAKALLTGDRSALPRDVVNAMRDAGLAHLLAISGLHMGLVAATIFFVAEALLAMIPAVALRMPPAKLAALIAWTAALGYLVLSGGAVSTIRAFIMISIALIGILVDRRAISLRSVALAAIVIMVIWPEMLVSVGFQMSFAAVTGLVVFYEKWGRKIMFGGFVKDGKRMGFGQKLAGFFIASISTTLIAELAIAPLALYHFQSVALYGLLANMIAVPLMSFLIMPLLLLSLLLMPFGLEWLVLPVVEPCLALLMAVAAEVSSLPGATASTAELPFSFLGFALLLALLVTMLRGRVLFALVPACIALMILVSQNTNEPDMYISKEGRVLAIRQTSGVLAFDSIRHSYQKDAWRRLNGEGTDVSAPLPKLASLCDSHGCLYRSDRMDMPTVARVDSLGGLMSECGRADIIITQNVSGRYCRSAGLVIDYKMLAQGPISLWFDADKVSRVRTVEESLGLQPWVTAGRQ